MKEKQEKTCATCHYCYHHPDGRLICNNTKLLNWPWVIKESDTCENYVQAKSLEECIKQATPKLSSEREEEEKCCGACCYMIGEDCYGYGFCAMCEERVRCFDKCDQCHGDQFVSKDDMERAVKVLEAHNRWRRDDNVPNSQPMVDPKELGKAIDLAVNYIKTYMEL